MKKMSYKSGPKAAPKSAVRTAVAKKVPMDYKPMPKKGNKPVVGPPKMGY